MPFHYEVVSFGTKQPNLNCYATISVTKLPDSKQVVEAGQKFCPEEKILNSEPSQLYLHLTLYYTDNEDSNTVVLIISRPGSQQQPTIYTLGRLRIRGAILLPKLPYKNEELELILKYFPTLTDTYPSQNVRDALAAFFLIPRAYFLVTDNSEREVIKQPQQPQDVTVQIPGFYIENCLGTLRVVKISPIAVFNAHINPSTQKIISSSYQEKLETSPSLCISDEAPPDLRVTAPIVLNILFQSLFCGYRLIHPSSNIDKQELTKHIKKRYPPIERDRRVPMLNPEGMGVTNFQGPLPSDHELALGAPPQPTYDPSKPVLRFDDTPEIFDRPNPPHGQQCVCCICSYNDFIAIPKKFNGRHPRFGPLLPQFSGFNPSYGLLHPTSPSTDENKEAPMPKPQGKRKTSCRSASNFFSSLPQDDAKATSKKGKNKRKTRNDGDTHNPPHAQRTNLIP